MALLRADTLGVLVLDGVTAIDAARIAGTVTRYAAADRSALSDGRISLPGTALVEAIISPQSSDPIALPSNPARVAQTRAWLKAVADGAVEVSLQIPGDAPFAGLLVESVDERRAGEDSSTFLISLVEVTIASTRAITLTALPRPPAVPAPGFAAGQATTTEVGTRAPSLLAAGVDAIAGALGSGP